MKESNIHSEEVVLELFGIDKKWVKSPKGGWVDKQTLEQPIAQSYTEDDGEYEFSTKKWWQFWK